MISIKKKKCIQCGWVIDAEWGSEVLRLHEEGHKGGFIEVEISTCNHTICLGSDEMTTCSCPCHTMKITEVTINQ